ncbi:MAG: hypothetical protein HQK88_11705 [Nitrospirae bacterium]|nr:hypothetical protein [Nitrospirota bacterium]MBF0535583.1 hypothetical protein [Nitrospirota bacterium]MBF0617466.1 hypothetical protein [Nitrospirota bacterium]
MSFTNEKLNPKSCIEKQYKDFIEDSCGEEGCYLNLVNVPDCVILKGEKVSVEIKGHGQKEKSGDNILFVFKNKKLVYLAVTEYTHRKDHGLDTTIKKLNTCVKSAFRVMETCKLKCTRVEFFPIVLAGRFTTKISRRTGRRKNAKDIKRESEIAKITFGPKAYPIYFKTCGTRFMDIVKDANIL